MSPATPAAPPPLDPHVFEASERLAGNDVVGDIVPIDTSEWCRLCGWHYGHAVHFVAATQPAGPATPTPEGPMRAAYLKGYALGKSGIGPDWRGWELDRAELMKPLASGPAVSPQPEPPRMRAELQAALLEWVNENPCSCEACMGLYAALYSEAASQPPAVPETPEGREPAEGEKGALKAGASSRNTDTPTSSATVGGAPASSDRHSAFTRVVPNGGDSGHSTQPPAVPVQDTLTTLLRETRDDLVALGKESNRMVSPNLLQRIEAALRREPPAVRTEKD